MRRIRFRFVLVLTIMTREELWTSVALLVDGLRVRLRGFRKSHHLIPAGPAYRRDCEQRRGVRQGRIRPPGGGPPLWNKKRKGGNSVSPPKASPPSPTNRPARVRT